MEHHDTFLTIWLNKLLGPYVLPLLEGLGFHPHDRANPISELFVMSVFVVVLLSVFSLWLRRRLSVERPGATQQVIEILFTNPVGFGIRDLLDQNAGHHGRKYMGIVATVAFFVLTANLISVLPSFTSPAGNPSGPLACALITFLYFNYQGFRAHGFGYLKHFAGPVWWMSWLIFPVEIVSTTARILSLTVRLWANMFSSELIYYTILRLLMMPAELVWQKLPILGPVISIFPATVPVLFILLHIFVAVVQALVFTLLPTIYIGLAVAEEH
jgi:F-type H+-transporting ATPase subunit a